MTDKNYTHLTLVVDRSGSMGMIKEDAQGGINTLLKEQRNVEGELTVTIIEFDNEYNVVADAVDIKKIDGYTLVPRGSTALNDAIGKAINTTGEKLSALHEDNRPGKVLFVIVTDGGENASKEYTSQQIKDLVKHQEEKYNWDFTFIGANIDAFNTGMGYGIRNNVQYAAAGQSVNNLYGGLSRAVTQTRTFAAKGEDSVLASNMASDYSDEE